MTVASFGTCLFDRTALERLTRLWDGPLVPSDLGPVERCLRSLLVYETLAVARGTSAWSTPAKGGDDQYLVDQDLAFSDGFLDYLFREADLLGDFPPIADGEGSFLRTSVVEPLQAEAVRAIPESLVYEWQFLDFLDRWYIGADTHTPDEECVWFDEYPRRMTKNAFLADPQCTHVVFHGGPLHEAEYIVRAHAKGFGICSCKPIVLLCHEHIFSKWPEHLFERLDSEFRGETRFLLPPGFSFELPPLTALVLSRAARRSKIPETIVALREELSESRKELWETIGRLWGARTHKEQIELNRLLQEAAEAIYESAFPQRFDTLSVALDFARLTPSGVSAGMKQLLAHDMPAQKVKAVTFAAKLSDQLRRFLGNQSELLKRHLSTAEIGEFGRLS